MNDKIGIFNRVFEDLLCKISSKKDILEYEDALGVLTIEKSDLLSQKNDLIVQRNSLTTQKDELIIQMNDLVNQKDDLKKKNDELTSQLELKQKECDDWNKVFQEVVENLNSLIHSISTVLHLDDKDE